MEELVADYFISIFLASKDNGLMDFLMDIKGKVFDQMDKELSREFTIEEICKALKKMYSRKARRLDGMPSIFFQKHWHMIANLSQELFFRH